MNSDKSEANSDYLKVDSYQVTFDEAGAHIEHQSTHAHYRVQAATATNAVDFMKHHKRLIFAMLGKDAGELEVYRDQQHLEGGNE